MQHFIETNITLGLEVERGCCVLLEDHLFVLHKKASPSPTNLLEDGASMPPKYCIFEFHLLEKSIAWVKLRVHSCGPCQCYHDTQHSTINLRLLGCSGFLLVFHNHSKRSWLYNLSTCEWRTLPSFEKPWLLRMMCMICWSAFA